LLFCFVILFCLKTIIITHFASLTSPSLSFVVVVVAVVMLFNSMDKKRIGYWTDNNCENTRNLFSSVAQKHGRNPLVAEDWYTLTKDFVLAEEVFFFSYSQEVVQNKSTLVLAEEVFLLSFSQEVVQNSVKVAQA
jgi:hypothetical protein